MTPLDAFPMGPDAFEQDAEQPGFVFTAETAADVAALAGFPALSHLLGPEHFARLARGAAERAEKEGVAPADVVHSLLLRRSAPIPADVPSRLAADVAAVEHAIARVASLAPDCIDQPRVPEGALDGLDREFLHVARLEPIRALGIVPAAYRVDGFVRRVRAGKLPPAPKRQPQTVVVYALGPTDPIAWWRAVSPAEGLMLERLALQEPLGHALHGSIGPDGFPDERTALDALDVWLSEGIFSRLVQGDPYEL